MARHQATQRHRALDVVFEADQKGILVPGLLRELLAERREVSTSQVPIQDLGAQIVETLADHLYEVDELIDSTSKWGLRRLSSVDRNVLRLGIAELSFGGADLPDVVRDYTDLVRGMSGEKSISFVTAIFNRVVKGPAAPSAQTPDLDASDSYEVAGRDEANMDSESDSEPTP